MIAIYDIEINAANVITIMNLTFGLLSIYYIMNSDFISALRCIILAAVCDAIDGAVARRFNLQSAFGAQIDSLSDIVSFGIAPIYIIYHHTFLITQTHNSTLYLSCIMYCVFASMRLARFNIAKIMPNTNNNEYFHGIPMPVAGLSVMSINIMHHLCMSKMISANHIIALIIFIALLMISKIPMMSHQSIPKTLVNNIILVLLIGLTLMYPCILLPLLSAMYMVVSLCYYKIKLSKHRI
jgi:CDP-diacylglycerol--serine O-phosphatidyltransferase